MTGKPYIIFKFLGSDFEIVGVVLGENVADHINRFPDEDGFHMVPILAEGCDAQHLERAIALGFGPALGLAP